MKKIHIAKNQISSKRTIVVLILICVLSFVLAEQVQSGGGYKLISGEVGISGESSGGGYSQVGSVLVTDGNEMSGGGFTMTEVPTVMSDDCIIGFEDFARLADYWMQSGTGLPADLYEDGFINSDDLIEIVNLWLCYCPFGWPLR